MAKVKKFNSKKDLSDAVAHALGYRKTIGERMKRAHDENKAIMKSLNECRDTIEEIKREKEKAMMEQLNDGEEVNCVAEYDHNGKLVYWYTNASTTGAQTYQVEPIAPFYDKYVKEIQELMEQIDEEKMYERIIEFNRIKEEHVLNVINLYRSIKKPMPTDITICMDALNHILDHLKGVVRSFYERQREDLEIYRNFLSLKFAKGVDI
jgi:hypothetical protein